MNPFNTMKHKHTLVLECSTLKSKADPRKGSGGDVPLSGGEWGLCQQGQDGCPPDKP